MIKDITTDVGCMPQLDPTSEDITCLGCKTWRNQARTEPSLEISFSSARCVTEVESSECL